MFDVLFRVTDELLQEELDFRLQNLTERPRPTGIENIPSDMLLREQVRRQGFGKFEIR